MTRVLLPVRVLEGEIVAPGVIALLARVEVSLLGYHVVPEQTAPAQARMSFEDRANAKLDEVEGTLAEAGASVDRTLAFTHDAGQTIERVATDEGCDAVAYLNPASACDRVLVVLHGDVDAERVAGVTAGLVGGREIEVGLLEMTGSREGERDGEGGKRGEGAGLTGRALEALAKGGVDRAHVHEMAVATDAPVRDITIAAADFDAIVLGEREPSLAELVLGDFQKRVAAESLGPVVVVRQREEPEE